MNDHFKDLTYTPAVRRIQAERSSPAQRYQPAPDAASDLLGPDEAAFIEARDTLFMATVSSTGWPYVQHRGGPVGFVHVLDATTMAFADVRGNRQYISAGNLATDDRVAFIFIDYAARTRLKLLGHARVLAAGDAPELSARLQASKRSAPGAVEGVMVVEVVGVNWNCPKHITPRYTAEELEGALAPVRSHVAALEAHNARLEAEVASLRAGSGKA